MQNDHVDLSCYCHDIIAYETQYMRTTAESVLDTHMIRIRIYVLDSHMIRLVWIWCVSG